MRNVRLVFRREYMERIRSRTFIIMTLLMPAFMASTVLLPAKLAEIKSEGVRHIVLVASDAEIGEAVKQQLLQSSREGKTDAGKEEAPEYAIEVNTTPTDAEREQLIHDVSDGRIDGFLWLTQDAINKRQIAYNARDVANFGETIALQNAVSTALVKRKLANKGMTGEQVEELLKPISINSVHVEKGKEGASGTAVFLTSFVMIMLLYANVLVYGFAVMRSIIEEKNSRILEVLLASVTAKDLLAGKILGVGAVGLTQVLIWIAMAAMVALPGAVAAQGFLAGVHIPAMAIIAFGVFFLLGYFLYSTMYAALGAMVNSDQEAQYVQWPAMLPIVFSIIVAMPVMQHPSSQMAIWLSLVPFFAPILMFVRLLIEQPPAWQLVLCVVLMLVTTYGLLLLSSRIYRVGILMYGKRPTLPELRKWLRYAD